MREVTSSTKIWGNVYSSPKAKQCARFGLSHMTGRLHLSPEKHDEALRAAGVVKTDVPKRSSEELLESSQTKRSRGGGTPGTPRPRGYQGSGFRGGQSAVYRSPSPVGNQYRARQQALTGLLSPISTGSPTRPRTLRRCQLWLLWIRRTISLFWDHQEKRVRLSTEWVRI